MKAEEEAAMDWFKHGACRGVDPDLFFPARGESTQEALTICAVCTVREECLAYAIAENIKHGVWGGMSERQRRRMREGLPRRGPLQAKPCETCGEIFVPDRSSRRCCSRRCGVALRDLRWKKGA